MDRGLRLDNVPQELQERTWYTLGNAYAILVDSPITLGHSQLRVKTDKTCQEEESFGVAASHVAKCVKILRKTLSVLTLDNWSALARYTYTSGTYVKTLVLKASANEPMGEYKIHLVPYFDSHLQETIRLHCATQGLKSSRPGGLLHWIGERERLVDYDMRYGRDNEEVKRRIMSFRLQQLASALRNNFWE